MARSTAERIPERCLFASIWAGESFPLGGF